MNKRGYEIDSTTLHEFFRYLEIGNILCHILSNTSSTFLYVKSMSLLYHCCALEASMMYLTIIGCKMAILTSEHVENQEVSSRWTWIPQIPWPPPIGTNCVIPVLRSSSGMATDVVCGHLHDVKCTMHARSTSITTHLSFPPGFHWVILCYGVSWTRNLSVCVTGRINMTALAFWLKILMSLLYECLDRKREG